MTENLPVERGPNSMSLAAAADIGFGASGLDVTPDTLGEVVGFAKLMATAQHAIPKHLRENPGACMAVTLQALSWKMSPFAVAQKTYSVSDTLAYEAQVIAAVVNSRAGFRTRPQIDFEGDGQTRKCKVTFTFSNGDVRTYESPEIGRIKVKNSPLWTSDPDQQLSYFSLRSAARRHCPEVILGVLDRDEVEYAEPMRQAGDPPSGTGMVERLTARATDVDAQGFNVRNITEETRTVDAVLDGDDIPAEGGAKPKRKRRTKAEMEAARAAGEPEGDDDAAEGETAASGAATEGDEQNTPGEASNRDLSAEDKSSQAGGPQANQPQPASEAGEPAGLEAAHEAEAGDADMQASPAEDDRPQPDAPTAEPAKTTPASATPASGASAAATSSPAQPAAQSNAGAAAEFRAVATAPHAKPGQTYHLASDPVHANGTRPVYRDGVLAGHALARDRWSVFNQHAPEVAKPSAVEEKSPLSSADLPGQDYEPSADVGEFKAKLAAADSYQAVRLAIGVFRRTKAFQETESEGQREWQGEAYERLEALRDGGVAGVPEPTQDPWVWALWAVNAPRPEIVPALEELKTTAAYAQLNPAQKAGLDEAAARETGD